MRRFFQRLLGGSDETSKQQDAQGLGITAFLGRILMGEGDLSASNCYVLSSRTPLLPTEQVGGKAHNLIKLFRMGVPVPETCVITCDEYEQNSNGTLSGSTRDLLERFLDPLSKYAVRSSASCEDGADSAFAGRFTTELNVPGDVDSITRAVLKCWSSMKAPELVDKLTAGARMGVVVMRQIDSKKSGVLFEANPVTGSRATYVITATYGQGEGVVGGKVPVDTYSLKESNLKIRSRLTVKKTRMVRLNAQGGVEEADVPAELQDAQCLSDAEIIEVAKAGQAIRSHCHSPQDIEFCFAEKGKLYILQTRPITTLAETLEWKAPEPGLFQLNGHLATPISEFYAPCWMTGNSVGTKENTDNMGLGIVKVDCCTVNGFAYFCMRNPGPKAAPKSLPPPFLLRMIIRLTNAKGIKVAQNYWKEKRWRTFMEKEYPVRKAGWKKEMEEWQGKLQNVSKLDDEQLATLVNEAQTWGARMYAEHAGVTMNNLAPVAFFVKSVMDATDCTAADGFCCIDGFSPISIGFAGEFPDQMAVICSDEELVKEITDPKLSSDEQAAKDKWMEINARQPASPSVKALQELLGSVQYRLAEGYDTANPTMWECPVLVFCGLQTAVKRFRENFIEATQKRANEHTEELFAKIKDVHKRAEIESLLEEARLVAALRDERAILTDLTACGIIHHILLEVGKRLAARSASKEENVEERLILYAKREEMEDLLRKKDAPPPSFWTEMGKRRLYRETASISDAPPLLGGPLLVPTADHFPDPYLARSVHNVMFVIDQIFAAPDLEEISIESAQSVQNDKSTIVGFSGAKGICQGRARIIHDAKDAAELQDGEICVTKYPSSVINILLGKAGGIVTDLSGILCHAAICAREAELPCVIGCHSATTRIKTGDLIEVDGTKGVVKILPQ